jgi:hypothetical protein
MRSSRRLWRWEVRLYNYGIFDLHGVTITNWSATSFGCARLDGLYAYFSLGFVVRLRCTQAPICFIVQAESRSQPALREGRSLSM